MENKAGKIIGFIVGLVGFLFLFKVLILVNIPPEDEMAPGIVVIAAILNGLLFAFMGHLTQNALEKKSF